MTGPFEAWRRNFWLWSLPFAFCVFNLLVLAFYRSVYAGEVERLEARHRAAAQELAEMERTSAEIEVFLTRVEDQRGAVQRLQEGYFLTKAERLTRALKKVKELARSAGLDPTSFTYPEKALPVEGLIEHQFQFSVEGSYRQLRTFINFLELTDQFLTLNGVSLSSGGPDRLRIEVRLSTVFLTAGSVDQPSAVEAVNQPSAVEAVKNQGPRT